jgi:hypothetical protein
MTEEEEEEEVVTRSKPGFVYGVAAHAEAI